MMNKETVNSLYEKYAGKSDTKPENVETSANVETSKEIVKEEPAVIEEPTKEVVEAIVPQKTYSIIVASSPNAQNAQLAIKELTRKMTADYTVVVGGGRHRISIGDYSNMSDANDALSLIKNTFPDAWVLTH